MPVSGQQALGFALAECTRLSHGGYVLVRTGQRRSRDHAAPLLEYRVNVRLPRGAGELTTQSATTLLLALQRALVRLQRAHAMRAEARHG